MSSNRSGSNANPVFDLPDPLPTREEVAERLKDSYRDFAYLTRLYAHLQSFPASTTTTTGIAQDAIQQQSQLEPDEGSSNDNREEEVKLSQPDNPASVETQPRATPPPKQNGGQYPRLLDDTKRPVFSVVYPTPEGRATGRLSSQRRQSLASVSIIGLRCCVSNVAGPAGVQVAHIVASATSDNEISLLEEALAIVPGGLNLNSSLNTFFLSQPLHNLFDSLRSIVVVPMKLLKDMLVALNALDAERANGGTSKKMAASLLDTIPPDMRGHVYMYYYLPLDPLDDIHDCHELLGRYDLWPDPIQEYQVAQTLSSKERRNKIVACRSRGYQTTSPPQFQLIHPYYEPVPVLSQAIPAMFIFNTGQKLESLKNQGRNIDTEIQQRYGKNHPDFAEHMILAIQLTAAIYTRIVDRPSAASSSLAATGQRRHNPPRASTASARFNDDVPSPNSNMVDMDIDDDDYASYQMGDDHQPIAPQAVQNSSERERVGSPTGTGLSHNPSSPMIGSEEGLPPSSPPQVDRQPLASTPEAVGGDTFDILSSPPFLQLPLSDRDTLPNGFGNPSSSFVANLHAPWPQPDFNAVASSDVMPSSSDGLAEEADQRLSPESEEPLHSCQGGAPEASASEGTRTAAKRPRNRTPESSNESAVSSCISSPAAPVVKKTRFE
ncbi:hypothetical protein FISHEDRAFT_69620 [Fistulina hepatica ATCC 64428]|uniref:HNH nuclease domain-containing protein n=1 Tax=Fistulina hepatica ATCC 64428 TaxID=1128425 RepID=A0A0D7AMM4_9AGAR|nr:hypothetical protein FISHEDRAFT_69620 [Fistulina hepatica ATCC 64428]